MVVGDILISGLLIITCSIAFGLAFWVLISILGAAYIGMYDKRCDPTFGEKFGDYELYGFIIFLILSGILMYSYVILDHVWYIEI